VARLRAPLKLRDSRILTVSPIVGETLFWLAVACCAIAEIAIVRSVARGSIAVPSGGTLPEVRRAPEIVWAVVPAVALAIVLAVTWRAMHRNAAAEAGVAPAAAPAAGVRG
jgi:hypothetical protein